MSTELPLMRRTLSLLLLLLVPLVLLLVTLVLLLVTLVLLLVPRRPPPLRVTPDASQAQLQQHVT